MVAKDSTEVILKGMYSRRNRFIHSGRLPPLEQTDVDTDRVIILTERLIMALLGVEARWVHPLAYPDGTYLQSVRERGG